MIVPTASHAYIEPILCAVRAPFDWHIVTKSTNCAPWQKLTGRITHRENQKSKGILTNSAYGTPKSPLPARHRYKEATRLKEKNKAKQRNQRAFDLILSAANAITPHPTASRTTQFPKTMPMVSSLPQRVVHNSRRRRICATTPPRPVTRVAIIKGSGIAK